MSDTTSAILSATIALTSIAAMGAIYLRSQRHRRAAVETCHTLRCDCKTWELSYDSTDPATLEEVREVVEAHMAECWRARHGRKLRIVR